MNEWQQLHQLRWLLANATWPDGSFVFNTVLITSGLPDQAQAKGWNLPALMVQPGSARHDRSSPKVVSNQFAIHLMVSNAGDRFGTSALMGFGFADDNSKHRGLLQIQPKLLEVACSLSGAVGLTVSGQAANAPKPNNDPTLGYVVWRTYEILSEGGAVDFIYPPPTRLAGSGGGGSVTLTWKLPAARFDFLDVVLRRASGSTPPATSDAGDGVTIPDPDADTSVVDSPGSGTWSYALFARYDPAAAEEGASGPATARAVSLADTVTVTI